MWVAHLQLDLSLSLGVQLSAEHILEQLAVVNAQLA